MAKFTWTKEELEMVNKENPEEIKKFIIACLFDRQNDFSNIYDPMYQKINEVMGMVEEMTVN